METKNESVKSIPNFLEYIFNIQEEPTYVIDVNDYTIKLANPACNFGNLTKDSTCHFLTHHQKKPCKGTHPYPCPIEEIKKTKQAATVEHIHYDESGEKIFVKICFYPILDAKKNLTYVIERITDITRQKVADKKLSEQSRLLTNTLKGI